MQAPAGSRAAKDLIVFENEFDALAHDIMFIVYIECLDKDCLVTCKQEDCGSKKCEDKANKEVYNFSKSVTENVFAYSKKHDVGVKNEVLSYYELEGTNTDAVKCQFASQTGKSTFLTYAVSDQVESSKRYDMIAYLLDDLLPSINPDSKRYKVRNMCAISIYVCISIVFWPYLNLIVIIFFSYVACNFFDFLIRLESLEQML